jgi:hypothetical protein
MDKLYIGNEMAQFDKKNRGFYDELTDEEKKKFSNYLMIRWGSTVDGSADLQGFYVISCNERLNKNFFAINRHPKLQWLTCTTVSPGLGTQRHQWIAAGKKKPKNALMKTLMELYPNAKLDELELLSTTMTKKELDQLLRDHGNDD